MSYRIDLALSFSNLGSAHSLERTSQPTHLIPSAGPTRSSGPWSRSTPKTRNCATRWHSALGVWPIVLSHMGRWKESRPLYLESVEIMDRIVVENPAVTEFRRVLATSAAELGQFLIDHDEIDAGFNALVKARDQAETVRKTNPNDVRNLNTLASILRGIGKTRARQGKTAEALDSLRQAIAIGERIALEDNVVHLRPGLRARSLQRGRRSRASPPRARNRTIHPSVTPTGRCWFCSKPWIGDTERPTGSSATRNSARCTPALISRH